jgi:hypothetical protein
LVARPRVSDYLIVRVDGVPLHVANTEMLAELASVDLDRRPRHDATCDAVGDGRVGEVISHRGAVRHVDFGRFAKGGSTQEVQRTIVRR